MKWDAPEGRISNQHWNPILAEIKCPILFLQGFKKYAKEKLGIKTIDCGDELCKVEHIGHSTDYESTKNSFIEYFIVTKAKYIKGKSFYGGISNFVYWPSKIYDIPYLLY